MRAPVQISLLDPVTSVSEGPCGAIVVFHNSHCVYLLQQTIWDWLQIPLLDWSIAYAVQVGADQGMQQGVQVAANWLRCCCGTALRG